jgi:hypothetical protein
VRGLNLLVAVAIRFLRGIGFTLAKPAVPQVPSFLMMALVYTVNGLLFARAFVGMRTRPRDRVLAAGLGAAVIIGGLALVVVSPEAVRRART